MTTPPIPARRRPAFRPVWLILIGAALLAGVWGDDWTERSLIRRETLRLNGTEALLDSLATRRAAGDTSSTLVGRMARAESARASLQYHLARRRQAQATRWHWSSPATIVVVVGGLFIVAGYLGRRR